MAEVTNVMYIVVLDNGGKLGNGNESFRYTRQILQSTLQLMGCKPRHAFKISKRVFVLTRNEISGDILLPEILGKSENNNQKKNIPSRLYKRRTTAFVRRENFLDIVCDALAEYKYVGPNQKTDLILACRIRERKESVTVLLCGTSGCGKSTLSALLGSRLGITTVISTDSIRHMMRSFVDEKENPLLWASTYHAGEFLDPVAVAEARARKQAKKSAGGHLSNSKDLTENSDKSDFIPSAMSSTPTELLSPKQMAIKGYKAQSEMVIESLDRLITLWEERNESVIVEGVHLSLNFVMGLMKKHPSIIPFMVYIANEDKHLERFAVRAKYMTLDPAKNKYVKYIRNIRTIQEYLCNRADKHLVPKINNTNVDKSVASIHATVFSCLRRRKAGELYDPIRNTVTIVDEEYRNQLVANSLGSKGMFQLIQRKGSSRNLMALVNTDGSVAKAWPVNSIDSNGKPIRGHGSENDVGNPMYGPLEIGKAEIVNIPFGLYGISAWPSDGGTSQAGSIDGSRVDGTDTGSRNPSSCCSSPRLSDGPFKELKEEHSVYGSDEEIEEPPETGSDEDLSDAKTVQDEVGSLDEESTKTDEEYDDLALQDVHENGYGSDDDEESKRKLGSFYGKKGTEFHNQGNEHSQNLDLFYRTKSEPPSELLCSFSSLLMEKNDKVNSPPRNLKMRRRSLSIPALSKRSVTSDPILSGPHQR